MMVPGGTMMMTSSAERPVFWEPWPGRPLGARTCLRLTMSARLSAPATARMMTLPPSPPSPPSGPPLGSYFSRRKLQHPRPPSPPLTKMVTRSTNMGVLYQTGLPFPCDDGDETSGIVGQHANVNDQTSWCDAESQPVDVIRHVTM